MKIAVLYGGVSAERDVSLSSGRGIIEALEKNNHEVIAIDFHPNKINDIIALNVDLVFLGLHGKYGEDGRIQGLLDIMGVPYVGSGVAASALAMDKEKSKQIFSSYNLPIAKSKAYTISNETNIDNVVYDIQHHFSTPFVVKPNREGSTLGLTIVEDVASIEGAIRKAQQNDHMILVEDYVKGRELTVAVLGSTGKEEALPIIEIIPKGDLYDYESKYSIGGSEHIIPAQIDDQLAEQIKQYAVQAHQALGCKTYSRVDFILNETNVPIILEVNTLPGMTATSLFPDAAKAVGMSYETMIEKFVQLSK